MVTKVLWNSRQSSASCEVCSPESHDNQNLTKWTQMLNTTVSGHLCSAGMLVLPHMSSDLTGNVCGAHETPEIVIVGGGLSCFSAASILCRSKDSVPVSGEEMLVVGH